MNPSQELIPLSLSQREVWIDQRLFPESPHLNIGGMGTLTGELDHRILIDAANRMASESASLRLAPNSTGSQVLLKAPIVKVIQKDFSDCGDPEEAMRQWYQSDYLRPIPLDGMTPPWHLALMKLHTNKTGLLMKFNHTVMDGWGIWLFYRRWAATYTALAKNQNPTEESSHRCYLSAIQESNGHLQSHAFEKARHFWQSRIPTIPPSIFDTSIPNLNRSLLPFSRLHTHYLQNDFYGRIRDFSETLRVTPYQVIIAAIALYFSKTHQRQEIIIGVPYLNRGGQRYKSTLGMFTRVLPLIIKVNPSENVHSLIRQIAAELRAIYRHQQFPLSELGKSLEILKHGRDRLFDLIFSFERQDYKVDFAGIVTREARQIFSGVARYPFAVSLCEFSSDQPVELVFEANVAHFAEGEIDLVASRIHHLIDLITSNPDNHLAQFEVLSKSERRQLLEVREPTRSPRHSAPTFVECFIRQAATRPKNTAMVWEERSHLTYQETMDLVMILSHQLIQAKVKRGDVIPIVMERTPELVICLLAVARCGATFLVIDPILPPSRLQKMLAAITPPLLLTQSQWQSKMLILHPRCEVFSIQEHEKSQRVTEPFPVECPSPDDIAYVIFTSGSTGQPKGVKISHRAVSHRLEWLARTWNISPQDRSAQITQATFDPALIELLLPLTQGASIALPPPGRRSSQELALFVSRTESTFAAFVPSSLTLFLDAIKEGLPLKLRVACCGGEPLPQGLGERFRKLTGGRLFNLYGPTEATIFATAWECQALPEGAKIPLGRSIEGVKIYVIEQSGSLAPIGMPGEICIAGEGLAEGYLGDPSISQKVFVPDPFLANNRMYRTGDRGYVGMDGQIYFVGRLDRQIKLRGYRIEPEEIESILLTHNAVTEAAVDIPEQTSPPALYAWVKIKPDTDTTSESLQQFLRQQLADYMVPRTITILPSLPKTSNGKIDYISLPNPRTTTPPIDTKSPPHTNLERQLASIWEKLLNVRPIGLHDDFFALGGDSLTAISLLEQLEAYSGIRYPLTFIMENVTIATQVTALKRQTNGSPVKLLLSHGSETHHMFLVASGHGDAIRFKRLARKLDDVCDLSMLQPPLEEERPFNSINDLSARYANLIADEISKRQGTLPIIAGFSVGGVTALETARLLEEKGIAVKRLILLDTVYPRSLFTSALSWKLIKRLVHLLRLQSLVVNGRPMGTLFQDSGLQTQIQLLSNHRPRPCHCPTDLIKTSALNRWESPLFSPWRRLFGKQLRELFIDGVHGSIFEPGNVDGLAKLIRGQILKD